MHSCIRSTVDGQIPQRTIIAAALNSSALAARARHKAPPKATSRQPTDRSFVPAGRDRIAPPPLLAT